MINIRAWALGLTLLIAASTGFVFAADSLAKHCAAIRQASQQSAA